MLKNKVNLLIVFNFFSFEEAKNYVNELKWEFVDE